MKKSIKIILIVIVILLSILLIDTAQAKLFNNRPVLKIIENYNGGNLYQKDKGILIYTYIYTDGTQKTVFRWEKYSPLEDPENQTVERRKISEAKLKANDTDVKVLVKFNDILYGKSYAIIDYAGDLNASIGIIDFVIGKEYVPLLSGETNQEELLNSVVLEANEKHIILNCNNEAILFNAIIEN